MAALVGLLMLTACGPEPPNHNDIPRVTVAPTASIPSPTSSGPTGNPPPTFALSPSCGLLTAEDVARALGDDAEPSALGNVFNQTNGFAGNVVDIDMCTWQASAGPEPGRSVQIQVNVARSVADAEAEFRAAVTAIESHYPSGLPPTSVGGIGSRAVRVPEWLIAQNAMVAIMISVSRTASGPPDPAVLENLGRTVAGRLGW